MKRLAQLAAVVAAATAGAQDHTVRLYSMRSAARRGETAACTLTFAIAPK